MKGEKSEVFAMIKYKIERMEHVEQNANNVWNGMNQFIGRKIARFTLIFCS